MAFFSRNSEQSTPEDRAGVVARAATRAFRDRVKAVDWLGAPNPAFGGRAPLLVAKDSPAGCALVCAVLDKMAGKKDPS
jgi:uncharacterized protein (DUF2384 family)